MSINRKQFDICYSTIMFGTDIVGQRTCSCAMLLYFLCNSQIIYDKFVGTHC